MMLVPVFILAFLCQTTVSFKLFRSDYDADFNLFVFTQWWPQTQCHVSDDGTFAESKENRSCVPQGITKWTIHGLWPTLGEEHKPVFCNSSWPFDESDVKDLKPKLEHQWPSFEPDHGDSGFWQHEWEKHGTCCTDLPYLNSEHKYFSVTLSLNDKYDIFSVLEQNGIVPSDAKTYQVKDIENALFESYQVHPTVYCIPVKGSKQMLSYVELCLDKQLCPINCLNSTADCNYDEPVQYPPIVPLYDLM